MVEKASSIATYSGSGTALVFGLTPSEWSVVGVIGGLVIALAGFVVGTTFQYLRWKRGDAK